MVALFLVLVNTQYLLTGKILNLMAEQLGKLIKLDIMPGFYTDETDFGAAGRWKNGDLVRFKNGLPQSIGGWESVTMTGDAPLNGIPRSNHDWQALDQTKYVAVGTEKRLYIIDDTFAVTNITPTRDTGSLTDPFSTNTSGSYDPNTSGDASFFNVLDAGHGLAVGDMVTFDSFTSPVGGISVDGDFAVIAVTDASSTSAIELMHDRERIDGQPTAYVCQGFACQRPVTRPDALAAQLRSSPT